MYNTHPPKREKNRLQGSFEPWKMMGGHSVRRGGAYKDKRNVSRNNDKVKIRRDYVS